MAHNRGLESVKEEVDQKGSAASSSLRPGLLSHAVTTELWSVTLKDTDFPSLARVAGRVRGCPWEQRDMDQATNRQGERVSLGEELSPQTS